METNELELRKLVKDLEETMKTGYSVLEGLYKLNIISWDDFCTVYDNVICPKQFEQIWQADNSQIHIMGYKMCGESNQLYISEYEDFGIESVVLPLENLDYCCRYFDLIRADKINLALTKEFLEKDIEKQIIELMGLVKKVKEES